MSVARTVCGDVPPDAMGITLSHEHVICDGSVWLREPADEVSKRMSSVEPSLQNLWWMKQFPNSNRSILKLDDESLAIEELQQFAAHGGGTIVELTCSAALGRDPEALRRISLATGLHIIASTGHYVAASHEPWVAAASIDDLAQRMVNEIEGGVGERGICCGVIGELGLSWPLHGDEVKVLRAAAIAQRLTGAAITIHTAAHFVDADSALVAADVLADEGADLRRVVMCHMDTSLHRLDYHRAVLDRGCYVEYDLFGHEFFESENRFQSPGDTERVRAIAMLIEEGFQAQLLLSHDICYKIQLQSFGGYGYAHLLRNVGKRMELVGVEPATFKRVLVDNPAAVFPLLGRSSREEERAPCHSCDSVPAPPRE